MSGTKFFIMKKQFQSFRFLFLAVALFIGLALNANNNVLISSELVLMSCSQFDQTFHYSWTAEPGAVSYEVDLVNTSTQEAFNWETLTNSVTAFGVPSGSYDVTVTAKMPDNTSYIIVVEVIDH